ncbi:GNAT family N-acetyltransferase [Chitinophaga rhizosphaerae]|uniref:GNAT family N-acetyltransferase n=1 Tax=Chitinophaga rhizosphaerae TaxID=1864947 RepID=UPI000F7FB9D4|nr:GNAT family N-acetyltransferase [Chitinophaga rhizosphaerae]
MKHANRADKALVTNILTRSFAQNRSVLAAVRRHGDTERNIRGLMEYAFDLCIRHGDVLLSDDGNGCALVLYPDRKPENLLTRWLDLKLVLRSIGWKNLPNVTARRKLVQSVRPEVPMAYLWFIGVNPDTRRRCAGRHLLNGVLELAAAANRPVYLETSVPENVSWYNKAGFRTYAVTDVGYTLYYLTTSPEAIPWLQQQ